MLGDKQQAKHLVFNGLMPGADEMLISADEWKRLKAPGGPEWRGARRFGTRLERGQAKLISGLK
jgi:hypothetical protein